MDAELVKLQADGAAAEPEKVKEVKTLEELSTAGDSDQNTTVVLKDASGQKMNVEDGGDGHGAKPLPDVPNQSHLPSCSSDRSDLKGNGEELAQTREETDSPSFSPPSVEEGAEGVEDKKEKSSKWVIVG